MKKIVFLVIIIIFGVVISQGKRMMDNHNPNEKHVTHVSEKKAQKERKARIKKELSQARQNVKNGKDLENTEKSIRNLLGDSLNKNEINIHLALYDVIKKQYDLGNEKLFLKQKYDTASLFNMAQRMFLALNDLDSVDALPDERGMIVPRYRRSNASQIAPYHKNLYGGGIFYLNHQKYKEAISCMDTYLSAYGWPLFSNDKLSRSERIVNHAGYIVLLAGYSSKDYNMALKYQDLALRYHPRLEKSLEYLAEIYNEKKNFERYEEYLKMGVDSFPQSSYFYPHLIDYYSNHSMNDKAMLLTDNVIAKDSTNLLFKRVKQMLLLNEGKYEECITLGDKILEKNDSLADVNYNVGLAYYNMSIELSSRNTKRTREFTRKINDIYRKCRPYMERYRSLRPEEKDKWRPILYSIYLNLNLGKEFEEIQQMK